MSRALLSAVLLLTGCDLIPCDLVEDAASGSSASDSAGSDSLETTEDSPEASVDTGVDTGDVAGEDTYEETEDDAADTVRLIRTLPDETWGYLTLTDQGMRDIAVFEVIVSERTYADDGSWTDEEIARLEVGDEKYADLSEYLGEGDRSLSITVEGRSASGDIILTDGPAPIGPNNPWEHACSTVCNGPDYAWEVELYANTDNGGANLSLGSTAAYFDDLQQLSIPFYEYMDSTGFAAFQTGGAAILTYHGLPDFYVDGYNIVKLTGVTGGLSDQGGYPLTGTVYAVRKHLGPWVGPAQSVQGITGGDSNCQFMDDGDTTWERDMFDNYSDILADGMPSLTCSTGSVGGGGNTSDPGSTGATMANQFMIDCGSILITGSGDVYDVLAAIDDCPEDNPTNPGVGLPEVDAALSIHQLNDMGDEVVLTEADLFDEKGQFIGPEISLPAGLFNYSLQFGDGSHAPVVFELLEDTVSARVFADFLGAEVDGHSLTPTVALAAGATLRFTYTIADGDGKGYYVGQHVLDRDETTLLRPELGGREAPPTLVHTFTFEDGSQLELITEG